MVHLAMHDAVNAAQPRYRAYAYQPRADGRQADADAAVAAAVAAHDVLAALYPKHKELVRATLDATLLDAGIGAVVEARQEARRRCGRSDARQARRRRARRRRGLPARHASRRLPVHARLRLPRRAALARRHAVHDACAEPVPRRRAAGAGRARIRARLQRSEGHRQQSRRRAAQRRADAVRRVLVRVLRRRLEPHRRASWRAPSRRTCGSARAPSRCCNAAMADAYIAGWDSKMHYNLWRPVTAIQQAARDGNDATVADADLGAAAAHAADAGLPVHAQRAGRGRGRGAGARPSAAIACAFTMASPSALPEAPARSFASFSAAAKENADSRVRAGLHFRFADRRPACSSASRSASRRSRACSVRCTRDVRLT